MRSKFPQMKTTIFSVMSALAREHNALNLGQGFPEFDGDEYLKQRAHFHMLEGRNQYSPLNGQYKLRKQISLKLKREHNKEFDVNSQITVTSGASEAIFCAISTLVHAGDEVIIFDPAFDIYKPAVDLVGAKSVHIEMKDFKIDWNEVESAINEKTSMIILNFPHNPSGAVLEQDDIEALKQVVKDKDITILSDEVYEKIIFDGKKHFCLAAIDEIAHQTISIFSFGKTFHMTGWKVGYAVGAKKLIAEINKLHQYVTFCSATPLQLAIADMLEEKPEYLNDLPDFFQEKRDFFYNGLKDSKLKMIPSFGTYFMLGDFSEISSKSDIDFAKELVIKMGIATIPIADFYSDKKKQSKYLRFCFAKENETLQKAVNSLHTL